MRLYLLPLSTRRTLLYAERLHVTTKPQEQQGYADKAVALAAKTWASWEKKEKGWQRKVVDYGNHALRRISYEEWGLKSVPPLSTRRRAEELEGNEKVELVFPRTIIPVHKAASILNTLATERQALHRKRLITCVICMPLTIPVGLLPVIPNLPFFYLIYRAWSHWRAIAGGKHVQWLIQNKLLLEKPSETLDELYRPSALPIDDSKNGEERMILSQNKVDSFAEKLEMPALTIELERAIWQVETSLKQAAEKKAKGEAPTEEAKTGTTETKSSTESVKKDEKTE